MLMDFVVLSEGPEVFILKNIATGGKITLIRWLSGGWTQKD
jgi:hypothetical protein